MPGVQPTGAAAAPLICSPINGSDVCPKMPIAAHPAQDKSVNPTTQRLRRRRASEIAPRKGIETTTSALANALADAYSVFDEPRSLTSHTAKYSVAMFIEKMVFAKSYSAQLQ